MARITQEQIEQINEVFAQCKVKSQTAKIVGVSVASVNKYLIPDYIPKAERQTYSFTDTPRGPEDFIQKLQAAADNRERFIIAYSLSDEEWEDLKKLQKEIY